ncbi:outer membrane protein assembly factor BamE [Solimonas marina]|uniref:Outer membrane protein assembly factor BamE n=1 Tax=Solimonas marina TaxID=2714601 RepID=A0A969WEE4_9GAMM|nr:outer membrane protein assembly factor BamE [Solimonas marina]NKF23821.1 outer membrane protein assembly factor BamE [Solimonas marina]
MNSLTRIAISQLLTGACLLGAGLASAADDAPTLLAQIRSGDPASLREAAQDIAAQGAAPEAVLDALSDALLARASAAGAADIHAVQQGCRALGRIGNKRYYRVLRQLADTRDANAGLRTACSAAADRLGGAAGPQYQASPVAHADTPPSPPADNGPRYQPISAISPGMSMQQVYAIAGPPTATEHVHRAGSFMPYRFRDDHTGVTNALYRGQGRVIFSDPDPYHADAQVIGVQIDPGESGSP